MKLLGGTKYIHLQKTNQNIYIFGEFHYLHIPSKSNTTQLGKFIANCADSKNSKLFLELNTKLKLSSSTFKKISESQKTPETYKIIASNLKSMSNQNIKNKINFYDPREQVLSRFISKKYIINGYYALLFYTYAILDIKIKYLNISQVLDECVKYWEQSTPATKVFFKSKINVINTFNKIYNEVLSKMNQNTTLREEMNSKGLTKEFVFTVVNFMRDIIGMLPEMNLLNKLYNSKKKNNYVLIGHFHVPNIASALISSGWKVEKNINHKNLVINFPSV